MAEQQFWIGVHGVIEEHGRILVLRRAPTMAYRPGCWDLPGGHLAAGESCEEGLVREVAEETGLSVAVERLLGVNNSPGPYMQVIYRCRLVGAAREIVLSAHEHAAARWVAPAELNAIGELIPYLEAVIARGMLARAAN
jgi:8-oxo-dGTP diphosphatase